jgi:hypothetical protein
MAVFEGEGEMFGYSRCLDCKKAWHGAVGYVLVCCVLAVAACFGGVRLGSFRHGAVWRGLVGQVRCVLVRQGQARLGGLWHGEAGRVGYGEVSSGTVGKGELWSVTSW